MMPMPHARAWDSMPALSLMVTAFAEAVFLPYKELNIPENKDDFTPLNKVISIYPHNWLTFAKSFDPDVQKILIDHMRAIAGGKISQPLPDGLTPEVQARIENWVSTRTQPMEKTVREIAIIREAMQDVAREEVSAPSSRMDLALRVSLLERKVATLEEALRLLAKGLDTLERRVP